VGLRHKIQEDETQVSPEAFYTHPNGTLWVGDSVRWLESLEPASVDLIFADPPYNIGKADWDEFDSHDAYIEWSLRWIELASRVLKPHGSLYVCGFSEILADLRRPAAEFFAGCKWLVWFYKNKANLTKDWGRSHESILHYRKSRKTTFNVDDVRIPYGRHTLKYPVHPQAESSQYGGGKPAKEDWQPHPHGAKPKDVFEIPVTSNGMAEKTPHPTQKPEELIRKLILASSHEGDLVVDPFSGSGTTLVCAEQLNRKWAGCDLNAEYCSWTMMRLEQVPSRTVEEWLELDRKTAARRESIR
jgi:site-specific DNA-methyltransferase (adenine-specific)